jgi:surface protein
VGTLNLSLSPEDATVLINKQPVSNPETIELAPGRYRLDVEKDGFDSYSENLDVSLDEIIQKDISLEPQYGSLQFKVTPGNASVELFNSDGEFVERWNGINYINELKVGEYQLIAESIGYRESLSSILIQKDSLKTLSIELSNSLFYLAPNSVTVMCPDAKFGDTGVVNDITYTKRSRDQITTENASTTCTSGISNMKYMFYGATSFNQDISNWDVSNVTNMKFMFDGAKSFNQDISNWDVRNVSNMKYMFYGATSFNQDISNWDVSSVSNMEFMFDGATSFNQDISNWDVSSVSNMENMFYEAESFNQNISNWCVKKINSKPDFFSDGSKLTQWQLPKWGTCPNN